MIMIDEHDNTKNFYLLAKVTLAIRQIGELPREIRQLANTVRRKYFIYWRKSD